jgi:hypothetical protein
MSFELEAALVRLVLYCYRHERYRPGLRVVRRCAQKIIREAYQDAKLNTQNS